ncbi:MAG: hypothetical protein IPH75_08390 [bacterium]|nr:hypothetical protein [bacterium]
MIRFIRASFLTLVLILLVVILWAAVVDLYHGAFPLAVVFASILVAPFLEVPILLLSVWGILGDKLRLRRYFVAAVIMIAGLCWAYAMWDIPMP